MHDGEIDLVAEQILGREHMPVLAIQLVRESRAFGGAAIEGAAPHRRYRPAGGGATPDDMAPERDARTGDIAPEHVQPLVPGIELRVVAALEADAGQAERLHQIAVAGAQRPRRDVRRVGHALRREALAAQRGIAMRAQHTFDASGMRGAGGGSRAQRRRPRTLGISIRNGE